MKPHCAPLLSLTQISASRWGETVTLSGTKFENHFAIAYLVILFITWSGLLYTLFSRHKSTYFGNDARLRTAAFKLLASSMVFYLL